LQKGIQFNTASQQSPYHPPVYDVPPDPTGVGVWRLSLLYEYP